MKFKGKPVIVEAFRWTVGPDQEEEPEWIIDAIKKEIIRFETIGRENTYLLIDTLEGIHRANQGDYIIQGVKGELYPCREDIFLMTYEVV